MLFRKIFILLICGLLTSISYAKSNPTFHDTQGHVISLSQLKNKWIIINYWASWCSTCKSEVPILNQFYEHNRNKNILFYGVNFDLPSISELKQATDTMGITFPVLAEDPNFIWQLGEITAVPTTFVINPAGQIVKKFVGGVSERSLTNAMQSR